MSDVIITDKTKEEMAKEKLQMFFSSAVTNMQLRDFIKEKNNNSIFKEHKRDDIVKYLRNPAKYEKELRNVSKFLYNNSSHYKRLINYFANLHLLKYVVKPCKMDNKKINLKKFKDDYFKILNTIQDMNIPHEFRKILNVCFREDIFYGYEYSTDNSYFIKQLDSDYCQISSIEDGVYNFAFNFSYFDGKEYKLKMYSAEFKSKYNKYLKDKTNNLWQELDSSKTICIKVNFDVDYPLPPFIGVFEEIYDIQDYKSLKKTKKEIENYQLLTMKIPINDKGDYLIPLDDAIDFYNKACGSVAESIGMILTPMDTEAIKFDQDKASNDGVVEAEDFFWSSAGVNGNLFNSKGNSGSVVSLSTKVDEAIVESVIKQMERWMNRKIKFIQGKFNFKFTFLNVTINNEKDVMSNYLQQSQYGVPVKLNLVALSDMSALDIDTMAWLENDILDIPNKWKPLSSSFTQSDNKEVGANKKEDTELTDSGEQSREVDAHKSDNLISK